ncbi:hypothetical protein Emag_005940 [Eimeria magna]
MQTVRTKDQGVGDVGYKEISFGLCLFVAPPVVRDILRNRAHLERRASGYAELHRLIQRLWSQQLRWPYASLSPLRFRASAVPRQEPRSRPVQSFVTLPHSEEQVLRRFPRRRAGDDDFPPDYCPPYVLYSGTAFRRLGPPDLDRATVSPTFWEGNMDMEYSYAVAPYRVESNAQVTEDYAGRWRAVVPGGLGSPTLRAVDNFPARSEYRGPHLRPVGILDTYGPRHPRLPCGRFVDYYHLHSLYPSGRSPAYELLGPLAPSVASSVLSEETRARGGVVKEPAPPSPVISSASTPSTSVGGSPPGSTTPRQAPGAPEPPQRRRRLEPESALFPATSEPVDEVQSPPAPANDNSAGAGAESSADASHSTSH